jgi:NAD(P)-dependent dehydrogenase (short-subunit alcohol dehydrogenase family)
MGRTTAVLFAKEGAKVVVADIDETKGKETVDAILKAGGEATFVKTDVSKALDVQNLVKVTVQKYGRLDVLANNAGINPTGTVVDTSEELWERTININLKGVFLGMKHAIPEMIRSGGGSIINWSSVNGLCGLFNEAAYDASKGGVVLITKATALDFGTKNIRVNCICPGITDTPLIQGYVTSSADPKKFFKELVDMNAAFKRIIKPEEVSNAALFLASDESSGITGAVLTVDGGYTAL